MGKIEISYVSIDGSAYHAASARSVYESLGFIEDDLPFYKWLTKYAKEYGFVKGEDYEADPASLADLNALLDYRMDLRMARCLCMVANTEKGRWHRQHHYELDDSHESKELLIEELQKQIIKLKIGDDCEPVGEAITSADGSAYYDIACKATACIEALKPDYD